MGNCSNCKFFYKFTPLGVMGYCKRYPPTLYVLNGDVNKKYTDYPSVHTTDSCGEYIYAIKVT
jgi:hypothetical protein